MGKKKKKAAKLLALRTERLQSLHVLGCPPEGCKSKCCKKYKKGEHKRCSKCPCGDLLKCLRKSEAPFQYVA